MPVPRRAGRLARTRSSPSSPGRTPASGRGRDARAVAGPPAGRGARHRGAHARVRPSDPDFLDRLRDLAPDACPVVAYGALLPQAALDVPRARLGQPALLAAAGLARGRAGAARRHGRRRGHRRHDVPHRGGPRHRPGPRRDDRDASGPRDTAGDLLDRLAEGGAGLLVATMDGLADGSLHAGAAARRRGLPRAEARRSTTPGSAGTGRPSPSTARCAGARPPRAPGRRFAGERLKAAPVAPGRGLRRAAPLRPGRAGRGQARGPRRHGHDARARSARCGRTASGRCRPPTGPAASRVDAGRAASMADGTARSAAGRPGTPRSPPALGAAAERAQPRERPAAARRLHRAAGGRRRRLRQPRAPGRAAGPADQRPRRRLHDRARLRRRADARALRPRHRGRRRPSRVARSTPHVLDTLRLGVAPAARDARAHPRRRRRDGRAGSPGQRRRRAVASSTP